MAEYNRSIPDLMAEIEQLKAERDRANRTLNEISYNRNLLVEQCKSLQAERDRLREERSHWRARAITAERALAATEKTDD